MIETTSLELSKAVGPILEGKVKSFLCWHKPMEARMDRHAEYGVRYAGPKPPKESTPAYTACELMKVLPAVVNDGHLTIIDMDGCWDVDYVDENDLSSLEDWNGEAETTPAEALGQMVVWLHKEGLLE